MSQLIQRFGGGGIVISLVECFERYGLVRELLRHANITVHSDPRLITEWSSLMAMVGTIEAIERGILSEGTTVTVHGTGYYASSIEYQPLSTSAMPIIDESTPIESLWPLLSGRGDIG